MTLRRQQLLLFILCAAVLLAAGYGWGYAGAYARTNSASALLDQETLDLDFNGRLLHFADANEPEKVHVRLCQRLSQELQYADRIIADSDDQSIARDTAASLARARAVLAEPTKPPISATQAAASRPVGL
jgi:hypothetical protein